MEFVTKELISLLNIKKQNIGKALKSTPHNLKKIDGSSKKVKHYQLEDLPVRYQEIIKEKLELEEEPEIETSGFSSKYLLASSDKQHKAVLRCQLVEKYLKKDDKLSVEKWLDSINKDYIEFEPLGTVTKRQMFDWLRKYNDARAKGLNVVEELLDSRGKKKGFTKLSEELQEVAIRYFLRTTDVNINAIYLNMCHTYGNRMSSYKVLNKFYKDWKRANPQLSEFAISPDSWKNKYQVAFGSISAKAKFRNEYWELDSTPADIICSDGKRYTILGMIDIYSRRCEFLVAESSNAYSISQLLRKAILKYGIPENVVIDNGKDYRSNHFQTICINLGINMEIVPPFSGDMKPHIERMFGTMSRELFEELDGYIGHSVADREKLQARSSFASKIESQRKHNELMRAKSEEERKAYREAWKIKKENLGLDLTVLMSASELQTVIDNWNTKLYEQREHSSIGKSPIKKWSDTTMPVQSIGDTRMLDLLLGENIKRKVVKKGIRYDGAEYQHLELIDHIGSYVFCLVPSDWGQLIVYSEKMEFVCIAEDTEKLGNNRYHARAAKKKSMQLARQYDKLLKEISKHNDTTILDRIDDAVVDVPVQTMAVTKRTETIDMLLETSPQIAAKDQEALDKSNRYDFKSKGEDGKPQKVLPSGRPAFDSLYDRFVWALENKAWNEKDEKLKQNNTRVFELAKEEVERKIG
jgi:transposase InsO family protein